MKKRCRADNEHFIKQNKFQFIEQHKQTPTDLKICRGYLFLFGDSIFAVSDFSDNNITPCVFNVFSLFYGPDFFYIPFYLLLFALA